MVDLMLKLTLGTLDLTLNLTLGTLDLTLKLTLSTLDLMLKLTLGTLDLTLKLTLGMADVLGRSQKLTVKFTLNGMDVSECPLANPIPNPLVLIYPLP